MEMRFLIFLLIFIVKITNSIRIGQIKHSSVMLNTSLISTQSSTCLNCLCDCLNNSTQTKCYGINCFPSKHLCQRIERAWIQEADILFNSTSDQFISTINLNFCSCYSVQNILNKYADITPISVAHPSARYITYNPYDDTLIVLGDNLIGQYYVSNLTRFRNISTTILPLAVCIDPLNIYISFRTNMSVNQYDMNMGFIRSFQSPINSSSLGNYYGLARWNNYLFVTDQQLNLIWSIDVITMNTSIYLDMNSYNCSPFNIAVFNDVLYISQFSPSIISIFNLITFSIQTITFPDSTIPLYRLQLDPFCNRLWFGTNQINYTSVPVLNLDTNIANIYQANGALAQSTTNKVAFDSNYSMYTVAINENYFYQYQMSTIQCGN